MAITYIGSFSNVGDNGSQAGPTSGALPYASAGGVQTGDLVIVPMEFKGSGTTMNFNETNGQSWNLLTQFADSGAVIECRLAWCRYDSAVDNGNNVRTSNGSGTTAHTSCMFIFRPTSGSNQWGVDVTQVTAQFAAGTTPFTKTINSVTPSNASNITFAAWFSTDDNAWGSMSGTNWTDVTIGGDAQIRNLQGTDMSLAAAYQIQTSAAATNNVSKNQTANGGDAGATCIVTFYEFSAGTFSASASGSGTLSTTASGTGSVAGSLSGAGTQTTNLSGIGSISVAAAGASSISASMVATGGMQASISGSSLLSAGIIGIGQLSSNISAGGSVAAGLQGNGIIVATSAGSSSFSANLEGIAPGDMAADFVCNSTVTGSITGIGNLVSSMTGDSVLNGTLIGIAQLTANISASSILSCDLTGNANITADLSGTSLLQAPLNGIGIIDTNLAGSSVINATLIGDEQQTISASLIGQSGFVATISGDSEMVVNIYGSSSLAASLSGKIQNIILKLSSPVRNISAVSKISNSLEGKSTIKQTYKRKSLIKEFIYE